MGAWTRPSSASPLAEAMGRVGDRWTLPVVEALLEGPRRFGELARAAARDRPQHPHRPAAQPGARRPRRRPPLLAPAAALDLRAHRRGPRAGGRRAPAERVGRAPRRAGAGPPLGLRHSARGALVLPHMRAGGRRGRGRRAALRVITIDDVRAAAAPPGRRRPPHAGAALAHARRPHRRERVPEGRVPAARRRVQVPRRLQHDLVAAEADARAPRRRRLLVGQPRPGGRDRRRDARVDRRDPDAGRHAGRQARRDPRLRRRGRHLRPLQRGPRGARRGPGRRARPRRSCRRTSIRR